MEREIAVTARAGGRQNAREDRVDVAAGEGSEQKLEPTTKN
jgi:hypothetical protein